MVDYYNWFAVFTEFNGFFAFGLVEIGLAVVTGSQIKKEEKNIEDEVGIN